MASAGGPPPLRSLLFCPATSERHLAKLPLVGADAVAIDLEDAVADERKESARAEVQGALDNFTGVRTYVRVNDCRTLRTQGDVEGVVHPNLDGIVLAKVESPEEVKEVDGWLTASEREHGLPKGRTKMLVLLETALGVAAAARIMGASARVETAIFGVVDYMVDVGIDTIDHSVAGEELLYARSRLVLAARIAGCRRPLDGPFLSIRDDEGFYDECRRVRRLGFAGKMLIHPAQVELAHRAFKPDAEEVGEAGRIVEAFAAAEDEGTAAVVVDGRLVDYPIYRRAQRIVEAGR